MSLPAAAAGTSADSGGRLSAVPAPSSALSASVAASEEVEKASAVAIAACADRDGDEQPTFSIRSASRPAAPASATLGPNRAKKKAATA